MDEYGWASSIFSWHVDVESELMVTDFVLEVTQRRIKKPPQRVILLRQRLKKLQPALLFVPTRETQNALSRTPNGPPLLPV
jgi:hypothetical protein